MSTGGILPCHVCSSLFPCFSPHAICFGGTDWLQPACQAGGAPHWFEGRRVMLKSTYLATIPCRWLGKCQGCPNPQSRCRLMGPAALDS